MESFSEEAVAQLHNIGLVNASNLLTTICFSERERKPGNALRLHASDNLEGLYNTGDGLVLKTRVFTFGVLTDETYVNIGMTGMVTWNVLDKYDRGVDVKFLTESNVDGLMTRPRNRGVKDT